MPGLPFNSMPAAQAGDVRLGRMIGGDMGFPAYSEADLQRTQDPQRRPVVEMAPTPQTSAVASGQVPTAASDDPFATLDQLQQTAMAPLAAVFDQQEQMLKGQMNKLKDDMFRQYNIEVEGLLSLGLDREQLDSRVTQLNTKHKLAYAKQSSEFEPAMQEVSAKRQEAMAEAQAKFAAVRIEQGTYQKMIDDGTITPEEGRKRQFAAMGMNYDSPDPRERLRNEMRDLDDQIMGVENTVLNTREVKPGKFETNVGTTKEPEWQPLKDENEIAYWRSAKTLYDNATNRQRDLMFQEGAKRGLLDVAKDVNTPVAALVKKSKVRTSDMVRDAKGHWQLPPRSSSSSAPLINPVGGKIRVRAANGNTGLVPVEDLAEAVNSGYTIVR